LFYLVFWSYYNTRY